MGFSYLANPFLILFTATAASTYLPNIRPASSQIFYALHREHTLQREERNAKEIGVEQYPKRIRKVRNPQKTLFLGMLQDVA